MKRLPRPTITANQILDLCIESIRDTNLTNRLGSVRARINAAEADYVAQGENETLYLIQGTDGIDNNVSTIEMEQVYARTFVRSARTRHIYDSIKKLPENDICPLCGQRTVSTLDHYLPQTAHPALIVTPVNLVPACSECNKTKHALQASQADNQTLHPYFDNVNDERWLFATVKASTPAALIFSPDSPTTWDNVKQQRVNIHFKIFNLGKLYASHSAVELNNIRFGLQMIAKKNSPQDISDHLREIANSCAVADPNSWQRATYEALADSEWFCSGGYD